MLLGCFLYNRVIMKLLRKVPAIEVKRTFVIADHITQRKNLGNNRKFLKDLSPEEFEKKLHASKRAVLKLKVRSLEKLITPKWPIRINAYNGSQWYLAQMSPRELGVWTRAGNLPLRWTNGSLAETAGKVARGLRRKSKSIKRRPKHSIPNILNIKDHLDQKEKYLYPIVFKTDTGTKGRRRLKRKMKGDIDDGCMRSIAMAISGKDPILVYFGIPKKTVAK